MIQLVFALEFEGKAVPVDGSLTKMRAESFAHGQTLRTVLGPEAVESAVESAGGASASFDSELEIADDGTFVESGSISYGTAGSVRFRTVGHGVLGPGGPDGLRHGAVIWQVTGGEGQFSGASGLITSNFSLGLDGAAIAGHFVRLFLPSFERRSTS